MTGAQRPRVAFQENAAHSVEDAIHQLFPNSAELLPA